jgi:hypothetical protein
MNRLPKTSTEFTTALTLSKRHFLGCILTTLPDGIAFRPACSQSSGSDIGVSATNLTLAISLRYQNLTSYSDIGTVELRSTWPGAPLTIEKHRFVTAYRAPRKFFFRYDANDDESGDAMVIWCDGGPFQSWWKSTGVHEIYNNGRGATAFLSAQYPTRDTANLIAPHFFPKAKLPGPSVGLIDPREIEDEEVNGVLCRRIAATSRVTGVVTVEKRPIQLSIDKEIGLLRKILVSKEPGTDNRYVDDKEYVIKPVANPQIADDQFTFVPPGSTP